MIKPIIGEKFGDWTVISGEVEKYNRWYKFKVKCKCGIEKFVPSNTLRQGKSTCCRKCGTNKNYKGVSNLSGSFFARILEGAKARNIEVSITKEQILELLERQEYKCALSGLPLVMSKTFSKDKTNQASSTTASLDRIDSSKGYIPGNVQWVHKDINIMKNKFDNQYFIHICKLVGAQCEVQV